MKKKKDLSGRAISSFGVMRCYLTLFVMPPSLRSSWSLIFTVIAKFFLSQYFRKIHFTRIPVKHVDHKLDEKIPFSPEYLHTYMRFINYWINVMSMGEVKFGLWHGTEICGKFVSYLVKAYDNAYQMYKQTMTTTYRPHCDDRKVKAMRRADPHFLCVPSLHIAIICLTYYFYKDLFEHEDFYQSEKDRWLGELYKEMMAIARSVLYLKQHSVNCIPAALYMVCKIAPSFFSPNDAVHFIQHFLDEAQDISESDKEEIVNYTLFIFERFLLEGTPEDDWTVPVVRWLSEYEPYKPFYAEE